MLVVRLPNGQSVKLRHQPKWLSRLVPELMVIPYGHTIYVTRHKDLMSLSIQKLYHEQTHLEQQRRLGSAFIWTLLYFTSKKFRLAQEAEAYAIQIKHTVSLACVVCYI